MLRVSLPPAGAPALVLAAAILAAGCGPSGQTTDGGVTIDGAALVCTVKAPTACPDPPPHYPDIEPIIQRACVPCHQGLPGGNWPLLQYSHVADWQDVIRAMVLDCSMPPPDAGVPISDEERVAILTWIRCGFLE